MIALLRQLPEMKPFLNPANFKALPLAWMRSVPAAGTRSKRRDNLW